MTHISSAKLFGGDIKTIDICCARLPRGQERSIAGRRCGCGDADRRKWKFVPRQRHRTAFGWCAPVGGRKGRKIRTHTLTSVPWRSNFYYPLPLCVIWNAHVTPARQPTGTAVLVTAMQILPATRSSSCARVMANMCRRHPCLLCSAVIKVLFDFGKTAAEWSKYSAKDAVDVQRHNIDAIVQQKQMVREKYQHRNFDSCPWHNYNSCTAVNVIHMFLNKYRCTYKTLDY